MNGSRQPSIEEELIRWLVLVISIVSFQGLCINFFYDTALEVWIIDIILNIFYLTATYLIWFKKQYRLIIPIFIGVLFFVTPYLWFLIGGSWGFMPLYVLASITTLTILSKGKRHILVLGSFIALVCAIVLIEFLYPDLTATYDRQHLNGSYKAVFLVILISVALILSLLKRKYEKQNNNLKTANEQLIRAKERIELQKQLLEKQTTEINNINKDLENALQVRTGELKVRDSQLLKHLFFTNHILKAPLSRIIGLLNLLDRDKGNYKDEMEILVRLKNTINELKEIMRNIEREESGPTN